jgi:hypothetical protein
MSLRPRLSILLAATLCSTVPLSGCGKVFGKIAEADHVQDSTEDYVFDEPVDELWDEARIVLEEDGYRLEGSSVVDESVKAPGHESANTREWVNVRIAKVDKGHRVTMHGVAEHQDNGKWQPDGGRRRSDLEFALIERLDPEFADKVRTRAEEKKEKAEKLGRQAQDAVEDFADLLDED